MLRPMFYQVRGDSGLGFWCLRAGYDGQDIPWNSTSNFASLANTFNWYVVDGPFEVHYILRKKFGARRRICSQMRATFLQIALAKCWCTPADRPTKETYHYNLTSLWVRDQFG